MALSHWEIKQDLINMIESMEPRLRPYECIADFAWSGDQVIPPEVEAWQIGDVFETPSETIGVGLHRVIAISGGTLTCVRNIGRATLVGDFLSDMPMRKNPRISHDQMDVVLDQIVNELTGTEIFNLKNETIAVTTDDWYDVTDVAMEEVFSVWYIEDGEFRVPLFHFRTDPLNGQPKIYIGAAGFTGNVHVNYRAPYTAITEMPDRLKSYVVNMGVYKLYGPMIAGSTHNPGKRTDRTVQGGQEARDSYWFLREADRLRKAEAIYLRDQIKQLPQDRISQRARRYRP